MATHRIVLDITDEEIESLTQTLETLNNLAEGYEDDWEDTEEPLAGILNQFSAINSLKYRIEREL